MRPVGGEPDSVRITCNPDVMPLDQYQDAKGNGSNLANIDHHIPVALATYLS